MQKTYLIGAAGLLLATIAPAQSRATVRVFGQPDFISGLVNHGGAVDAASHNYPLGIAVDPEGGIYIADRNSHRVLFFANDGNAVADRVYGQLGSFTAHIANNNGAGNSGGPSANNLTNPTGVALDSKGGIFVNDRDNHRVLHFPKGVTTADRVYGQFGSFQGAMTNNDGGGNYGEPSFDNIGTYTLGVVVDKDDGLYVSDATNHRVLYFANDGDTTADRVYGQWDNMTTGLRNSDGNGRMGGPNARSLNFPRGLAVDTFGGLYVADRDNNRVLYFAGDGDTVADHVYGQSDNMTVNTDGNNGKGEPGAPAPHNLSHPKGVAVDAGGRVYVADSMHHRVPQDRRQPNACGVRAGSLAMASPTTTGRGMLYVTDTGNSRTLVINTEVR